MKPTGLHTGFSGGRDRMKSRIISWALFFNRGGMSPLTWKGESEIHIAVFHICIHADEINWKLTTILTELQCSDTCTRHKPPPVLSGATIHMQSTGKQKRYWAAFQLCWWLQNNSNCSSFKQQYLGFWSNEIKRQGCSCVYGRLHFLTVNHIFP